MSRHWRAERPWRGHVGASLLLACALAGCDDGLHGPLAVLPGPGGDRLTLHRERTGTGGTLIVADGCVLVEHMGPQPGNTSLLIWPADRTRWRAAERAIVFQRLTGEELVLRQGELVEITMSQRDLPEMTAADIARFSDIATKCGARGRFFVTDIMPAPR